MKTRILIIGAVLAVLAGCATVGERALTAGTTGSVRFEAEDVDAAIAISRAAKDAVAEACFVAIRKHTGVEADPVTKGIVSAYAAARVKVRQARAGLADEVHLACAPLIVDSGRFFSIFRALIAAP